MSTAPLSEYIYPPASDSHLRECFLGKNIAELPTPAAILDEGILRGNCERILNATEKLGVGFRPHVKTHKTTQITRLQLGENGDGRVVVSTVREAEGLVPLIEEGAVKDILYGLPLPPSAIPRLSALLTSFPSLTISVLIDHQSQLSALVDSLKPGQEWPIFVKLDMGTRRAGVEVESDSLKTLLERIRDVEAETIGNVFLQGFYCHAGHSYGVTNGAGALELLKAEVSAGGRALRLAKTVFCLTGESSREWTVSVGATPTAMIAASVSTDTEKNAGVLLEMVRLINEGCNIELHAGVYTMLDLQQLSTHVMSPPNELGVRDIAISILAEVVSLYPGRGADGGDEALVGVGTIGLGREPGKEWAGWGAVSNWGLGSGSALGESGWIVGRISQEHGILTENEKGAGEKLEVGKKVRIWPQHACIAGSGHGWYFVVDEKDIVTDVWIRWRGW